jgi:hypothetical protein
MGKRNDQIANDLTEAWRLLDKSQRRLRLSSAVDGETQPDLADTIAEARTTIAGAIGLMTGGRLA